MISKQGRVAEWFKAAVLKTARGVSPSWVRIPPLPPFQYRTGHAGIRRFPASYSDKRAQKLVFRSLDEHLALGDLDALGEGAQVVAAVAAAVDAHPLAGGCGESLHHLRRDRLMVRTVEHCLRPL